MPNSLAATNRHVDPLMAEALDAHVKAHVSDYTARLTAHLAQEFQRAAVAFVQGGSPMLWQQRSREIWGVASEFGLIEPLMARLMGKDS